MTLIIRNARVLTLDDSDSEHACADIVVENDIITAIGPDAGRSVPPGDRQEIDAHGMLAMPGLINGHFHSPGNLLKGAIANEPLELFMLYEVPPLINDVVSERYAYVRTMLGAVEMLKQGVTSVHDDAFFVPRLTDTEVNAVMRAYEDSGLRATMTLNQPNAIEYDKYPFMEALLPESVLSQMREKSRMPEHELVARYRAYIDQWHGAANGRLRAGVSCSAPQRVTPSYLQALSDLSRTYDIPFDMHILETRLQRVLGEEKFGGSLIRYVHDAGVLDERCMVVHAIWIDEQDVDILARSGCSIAHNPVSNLKIGSGIMPFRALREAGINICLGTDESTVDDGVNLWTVGKLMGLIHNVGDAEYLRWPTSLEVLHALTTGGAKAMLQGDRLGKLQPGYQADIILLDLDTLPFTPLNNLRRQLVYCESGASVRTTIVAGQIVVRDGRVVGVDEAALRAEIRGMTGEIERYMHDCREVAREVAPYYRKMYQMCVERDVGVQGWMDFGIKRPWQQIGSTP